MLDTVFFLFSQHANMTKPRKLEGRGEGGKKKRGKKRYAGSNAGGEIKEMSNKVEQLRREAVL